MLLLVLLLEKPGTEPAIRSSKTKEKTQDFQFGVVVWLLSQTKVLKDH